MVYITLINVERAFLRTNIRLLSPYLLFENLRNNLTVERDNFLEL